jgi:hypothetical protein
MIYERAFVVLAERTGIPLAYTTGVDIERDPAVLRGATAVYTLGHDEYWTPQRRAAITRARDAGANVAFLGANTCYRRIHRWCAKAGPATPTPRTTPPPAGQAPHLQRCAPGCPGASTVLPARS